MSNVKPVVDCDIDACRIKEIEIIPEFDGTVLASYPIYNKFGENINIPKIIARKAIGECSFCGRMFRIHITPDFTRFQEITVL